MNKNNKELEIVVKRGDISWAYFPLAYSIILSITIPIITLLPINSLFQSQQYVDIVKVILIILNAILWARLIFKHAWMRNKIVGLFNQSKEHKETFLN